MKRTIFLFLSLALVSLACLESVPSAGMIIPVATPAAACTKVLTPGVHETVLPTLSADDGETCVRVTAETAQNLRAAAGLDGQIVGHLRSGEVVQLVDLTDSEWWLIERGGNLYYARSIYLQEVECP